MNLNGARADLNSFRNVCRSRWHLAKLAAEIACLKCSVCKMRRFGRAQRSRAFCTPNISNGQFPLIYRVCTACQISFATFVLIICCLFITFYLRTPKALPPNFTDCRRLVQFIWIHNKTSNLHVKHFKNIAKQTPNWMRHQFACGFVNLAQISLLKSRRGINVYHYLDGDRNMCQHLIKISNEI